VQVRVWEISESRVVAVASLHQDMVTAAAFSPDGSRVLAGTMRGKCKFYDYTDGSTLDYVAQVGHCTGLRRAALRMLPARVGTCKPACSSMHACYLF
jgi:hypothetical protein